MERDYTTQSSEDYRLTIRRRSVIKQYMTEKQTPVTNGIL
jgi:hypothetical protein